MKKCLLTAGIVAVMGLSLMGCGNKDMWDTNYTFNKAIIYLQNGDVVEVEVKKWADYDGEQLQIESTDGTVYLTSSYNCTLIKE